MDFFTPSLSTLFPLLSIVLVTGLGVFVVSRDLDNPLNRLFGLISMVCVMWLFGTFMMFVNVETANGDQAVYWDRFIYLGIVFVPALEYHFSLVLARHRPNRALYAAYFLSLVFLFLSRSDLFVSGLFRYRWGVHAVAGPLHHLFLAFFFCYIAAFIRTLFLYYRIVPDRNEKVRIILAIVAFAILDLIGGLGFLPAYGIGIFPVSLIAPTGFALIIGYSIIRYGFLNIETFTAQVSVVIILILVGAQMFFNNISKLLDVVVFVSVSAIGFFLIRTVKRDMQRKEELQKISNSLARANQRLKELDNTKSEFLSIASHQLRTPLTAVKGYLSLVLEGSYGPVSAEVHDVLEKIYSANGNLIKLVEDLLNVSRIETGRVQYHFETVRLETLVKEVTDMFLPLAKDRGLELRLQLPLRPLPELHVDGGKIREAISNLIDNAIKYTPKGTVTVSVESNDFAVRVVVKDTGVGIRPEERENLFLKFVRSEESTKVSVSGTGLGLYVGKNFIEAHGGRMWAESEGLGKGSRFVVELPFRNPRDVSDRKMR